MYRKVLDFSASSLSSGDQIKVAKDLMHDVPVGQEYENVEIVVYNEEVRDEHDKVIKPVDKIDPNSKVAFIFGADVMDAAILRYRGIPEYVAGKPEDFDENGNPIVNIQMPASSQPRNFAPPPPQQQYSQPSEGTQIRYYQNPMYAINEDFQDPEEPPSVESYIEDKMKCIIDLIDQGKPIDVLYPYNTGFLDLMSIALQLSEKYPDHIEKIGAYWVSDVEFAINLNVLMKITRKHINSILGCLKRNNFEKQKTLANGWIIYKHRGEYSKYNLKHNFEININYMV